MDALADIFFPCEGGKGEIVSPLCLLFRLPFPYSMYFFRYPYPASSIFSYGMNLSAALLMQ